MKILKFLFNVSNRHKGGMRRYEKGGVANRIFVIILLLLLVGGSIALEFWCLKLLENHFLYAILAILFVFIPVVGASIEFCGVYSSYGFRMAINGTISKMVDKIADKIDDEHVQNKKQYKLFDLFIGFLGIILGVGLIFAIFIILVKNK